MSHRHLVRAALVVALGLTIHVPSASAAWVDHFSRFGHPPVALNPQPLPPGFRAALNPQPLPPGLRFAARLHCYGVQVGDPRTHPPARVCS
jgi:hypothetical protein